MLKRIINFFKRKKNKDYDVVLIDPDYLSFVLVEFMKNEEDDDYGFTFKYDERYSVDDVYDFLDSALCSLEIYMEFEEVEDVPVRNSLRVIEGNKNKTKNKGDL